MFRHREQGVGEIAPRIELVGAYADLRFDRAQFLGDIVGTAPPMPTVHGAVITVTVAGLHFAVMPGPQSLSAGGLAPGRGEKSETGKAEDRHDQDRENLKWSVHVRASLNRC